ncbi:MAG: dihydrodipicolinate synthase family protein [Terracidiphilus sp.]|jgi:4-hydroxy-tetrahydrodipicolinate synthase
MKWYGVMPAMTTCLDENLQVDPAFMTKHAQWLLHNGCTGIVSLGSLGQAATLTFAEKEAILHNMVKAAQDRAPVVAAISALSTHDAVALARAAEKAGCSGLMVLPPYVYCGDWREMKAHVTAVFRATPLSCMLYNNPVAYGTDFLPEQIAELAGENENFAAVKESSTDVRRVTAIRALLIDRLQVFVGVDDAIVEGIAAGAVGWVAGLVNAFPAESVALFNFAASAKREETEALYHWFLPMLRMDTVPKFVQLIHQVQQETGTGNARVRPPRLQVSGTELDETRAVVAEALHNPPPVRSTPFSRL